MQVNQAIAVPYENCFIKAASAYNIPIEILEAIAFVESNYNINAINFNSNGSYDLGIMQINSIWFNELEKKFQINLKQLKDPCQNIMIGTWILSKNIKKYGFNWNAIQHYNGYDTNLKYSNKIYLKIIKLYPSFYKKSNINNKLLNNSQFLFIK